MQPCDTAVLSATLHVFFPPYRQAIELMKQAGVPPNTYCMNSLMAVSVQARQPNTALEIFQEMERDGIPRDVVSDQPLSSCRLAVYCTQAFS